MSDATPSGDWSRSAAAQRQYNLVGGAILAVAGLILLATSFLLQNPVPLTVRGSVVIFTAVGIAIPRVCCGCRIRRTSTAAWR